jgi:hypothetical protein
MTYGGVLVNQGMFLGSILHKTGDSWGKDEDGSLTIWAGVDRDEVAHYLRGQWASVRLVDVEEAALFDVDDFAADEKEKDEEPTGLIKDSAVTIDAASAAWVLIANAWDGNWDAAPQKWREAAQRWRDRWVG